MKKLLQQIYESENARYKVIIPGFNEKLDSHYQFTVAKDEKAAIRNVIAKIAKSNPAELNSNPNWKYLGVNVFGKPNLLIWKIMNTFEVLKDVKVEKI